MRRKILTLIVVLACMISLSGCSNSKLKKVTIAEVTHSIFYAPAYVALEAGYFEDEGIDASLLLTQGTDKTMATLLSNEAQIGLMGPEATVYVYNQGNKDYAINFAQLTKRDGNFLLGREKDDNFKLDKLKGKTIIGGRQGGMPEMTLEYTLKKNGLKLGTNAAAGEVNVRTDVQFAAMAGAFIGGEGDYVTLFEPTGTELQNKGEGYILASMGQLSGEIPYTGYVALESYMTKNPDIIQSVTNAVYKGQQYVATHTPEEIAAIIAPQFKEMSNEDLVAAVKNYQDNDIWKDNPILEEESLNLLMDVMEEAGELEQRAPYDKVVNTDFAQKAMDNAKISE